MCVQEWALRGVEKSHFSKHYSSVSPITILKHTNTHNIHNGITSVEIRVRSVPHISALLNELNSDSPPPNLFIYIDLHFNNFASLSQFALPSSQFSLSENPPC